MTTSLRTETIAGRDVHAWSRLNPDATEAPHGYRGNEHQIVIRDQAVVYEVAGPCPVDELDRDAFVGLVAVMRATHGGSIWPFYGMGITDAGPSPYGWLWDDIGDVENGIVQ